MKKKRGIILAGIILEAVLVCGCSAGQQGVKDMSESGAGAPTVFATSGPSAVPESSAVPELPSISESSTPEPDSAPGISGENEQETDRVPAPDLNRNGIAEELRLTEDGEGQRLEIWENGEMIKEEVGYFAHAGWNSVFLCTIEGEDYLLHYSPEMYQGVCSYSYRLNTLPEDGKTDVQKGYVNFDINFGSPIHTDYDPEAIAAFMDEINNLLSHSVLLLNTHEDLQATFEKEGRLYDSLWWLDSWKPVFSRDENKSLLDNLVDLQAAMSEDSAPVAAQEDGLPITESLDMSFYSGAGAWANDLTLEPDGSFSGEYYDADCLTVYVCKYHGRFGDVEKLTGASWRLTLEELELDTGRDVGEEWDEPGGGEDAYHYISSEPYGLEGADDTALKPGAQLILYSPEATGHEPGTELYGAEKLRTWMHGGRREFNSADDILGCWGLHNLATGQGFFSDEDI